MGYCDFKISTSSLCSLTLVFEDDLSFNASPGLFIVSLNKHRTALRMKSNYTFIIGSAKNLINVTRLCHSDEKDSTL